MFGISRKESIFDGLSTKEAIVYAIYVENENNLYKAVREQSGSEATMMEIYDF